MERLVVNDVAVGDGYRRDYNRGRHSVLTATFFAYNLATMPTAARYLVTLLKLLTRGYSLMI